MITIYDIARELSISPSTVSRTFSNPTLVKEKTRKKVLEKAQEMGYQVNLVASQLRNQTSNIIALVSLQKDWTWFTDILSNGVQDEAYSKGYEMLMLNGNNEFMESISICEKMRFAGVIVASTELGKDKIYSSLLFPIVYVNRIIEDGYRILPDDGYGIEQEIEYLRQMGHSKIGFINGPKDSLHSEIRYAKYIGQMKKYGFPVRAEWVRQGNWSVETGYREMAEILKGKDLPTAVMAANDQMCVGIYQIMAERGMRPGEEISIVGYDDQEYSRFMIPPLTTVSIPLYEMGRAAGKMLLAAVRGEKIGQEVIVKGELKIRGSVKHL